MTVLPFLVFAAVAGIGSLVLRANRGWSTAIAVVGLIGMAAAAASMSPSATIDVGGTVLSGSAWLRLYALLGSVVALGLVAVDVAAMHEPDVPGVIVLGLGSAVLALALPDPRVAVLAATAGGLVGVLVAAPVGAAARSAFVGVRELRALAVAGALAIVATAWVARPLGDLAVEPAAFGLAYLAFGVAVAVRFGAIPFHLWAARVADAAPGIALPLLMAWGPAAFAAVALVWIDQSVAPLVLPLSTERALIASIGTVSLVLGLVAAWIQDDLEHVVGYSIVVDAGVVILGLAALDPAAWEPARTWLLVFVVGRSAFAAWVVAIHGGFGTRRLPELVGWVRRAPLLDRHRIRRLSRLRGVASTLDADRPRPARPVRADRDDRPDRCSRDLRPDPADRKCPPGPGGPRGSRRAAALARPGVEATDRRPRWVRAVRAGLARGRWRARCRVGRSGSHPNQPDAARGHRGVSSLGAGIRRRGRWAGRDGCRSGRAGGWRERTRAGRRPTTVGRAVRIHYAFGVSRAVGVIRRAGVSRT
jgi:NADH:ubiquinone oxidoreductase subunit 2 (subunit N)